jgi:hypothetical protein
MLSLALACATQAREVRPHLQQLSGPHLARGTLSYVFAVPAARAHEAMEAVLRERFKVAYVRNSKAALDEHKRYGEIGTELVEYDEGGKKYRKKCEGDIYVIREHPGYSKAALRCIVEVYELGLIHGRGGIHNVFTQWWDWYPENGLYLAEDLLEQTSARLGLTDSQVIRLNKKDFYPNDEIVRAINARRSVK